MNVRVLLSYPRAERMVEQLTLANVRTGQTCDSPFFDDPFKEYCRCIAGREAELCHSQAQPALTLLQLEAFKRRQLTIKSRP